MGMFGILLGIHYRESTLLVLWNGKAIGNIQQLAILLVTKHQGLE